MGSGCRARPEPRLGAPFRGWRSRPAACAVGRPRSRWLIRGAAGSSGSASPSISLSRTAGAFCTNPSLRARPARLFAAVRGASFADAARRGPSRRSIVCRSLLVPGNTRITVKVNRTYPKMAAHYDTPILPARPRRPRANNRASRVTYPLPRSLRASQSLFGGGFGPLFVLKELWRITNGAEFGVGARRQRPQGHFPGKVVRPC